MRCIPVWYNGTTIGSVPSHDAISLPTPAREQEKAFTRTRHDDKRHRYGQTTDDIGMINDIGMTSDIGVGMINDTDMTSDIGTTNDARDAMTKDKEHLLHWAKVD
jgi:hypothetical protein